jgi:hypothetical protein
VSRVGITCSNLSELVTDYLEDALPAEEHTSFEMHLVFCEDCLTYLGQMRATVQLLCELQPPEVPADERRRLVDAFSAEPPT